VVNESAEQAERTRRAILDAARQLFETEGYAWRIIRTYVAAAGATKGACFTISQQGSLVPWKCGSHCSFRWDSKRVQPQRRVIERGPPYRGPCSPAHAPIFKWAHRGLPANCPDRQGAPSWARALEETTTAWPHNVETRRTLPLARKGLIREDGGGAPVGQCLLNALKCAGFCPDASRPGITAVAVHAFEKLLAAACVSSSDRPRESPDWIDAPTSHGKRERRAMA